MTKAHRDTHHDTPKTPGQFSKYTKQQASKVTKSTDTAAEISRNGKTEKWVKPGSKWQLVSRRK